MCGKEISLSALSLISSLLAASAAPSFRQQPHHRPHNVRPSNNFFDMDSILYTDSAQSRYHKASIQQPN